MVGSPRDKFSALFWKRLRDVLYLGNIPTALVTPQTDVKFPPEQNGNGTDDWFTRAPLQLFALAACRREYLSGN